MCIRDRPRRPRVRGAEGRASGGGRVRSILSRVCSETAFGNWRRGCGAKRVGRRRMTFGEIHRKSTSAFFWVHVGFLGNPRAIFVSPSSQERRFVFVRFPLVGVSRAKNLQFEILLTWRRRGAPFSAKHCAPRDGTNDRTTRDATTRRDHIERRKPNLFDEHPPSAAASESAAREILGNPTAEARRRKK